MARSYEILGEKTPGDLTVSVDKPKSEKSQISSETPKSDMIEVFIPVDLGALIQKKSRFSNIRVPERLAPEQAASYLRALCLNFELEFSFDKLADEFKERTKLQPLCELSLGTIMYKMDKGLFGPYTIAVGITLEEAGKIINERVRAKAKMDINCKMFDSDRGHHPMAIVHVLISRSQLSEVRQLDKSYEAGRDYDEEPYSTFFHLKEDFVLTSDNILSFKLGSITDSRYLWARDKWPKSSWPNENYVVKNPRCFSTEEKKKRECETAELLKERQACKLKLQIAQQEMQKLKNKLQDENQQCGFIRFFTDFHETKWEKENVLSSLLRSYAYSTGEVIPYELYWGIFCDRVLEEIAKHPKVMHTSWPQQSRTAKLLNEITENDGAALVENYALDPLDSEPIETTSLLR